MTFTEDELDDLVTLVRAGDTEPGQPAHYEPGQVVRSWAAQGRVSELVTLCAKLDERAKGSSGWALARFSALLRLVEEQLASIPGEEGAYALLAVLAADRVNLVETPRERDAKCRSLASALARSQTSTAFLNAAARVELGSDNLELLACWMHDIVLRGGALDQEPTAARVVQAIELRQHPLAGLPLTLLEAEKQAPEHCRESSRVALDVVRPIGGTPLINDGGRAAVAKRLKDSTLGRRLAYVVRGARVEAGGFALEPTILGSARSIFGALPLASTKAPLSVEESSPSIAWGDLFKHGRAFARDRSNAHARRAAWATFGALVGATPDATIEAIDAMSAACSFFSFGGSEWFAGARAALGIACLRAGGASVAVLAAAIDDA